MYILTICEPHKLVTVLTLRTKNRAYARNTALLCQENGLECTVTQELEPRLVKFKGI